MRLNDASPSVCLLSSTCRRRPRSSAAVFDRYCCKSLGARWFQLFPGRAGALRKNTWGSTQTTAHANKDFPSRATMPLNNAFLLRRHSRRFLAPSIFRLLQQNRPQAASCAAKKGRRKWLPRPGRGPLPYIRRRGQPSAERRCYRASQRMFAGRLARQRRYSEVVLSGGGCGALPWTSGSGVRTIVTERGRW
jgi:hypothetical protein